MREGKLKTRTNKEITLNYTNGKTYVDFGIKVMKLDFNLKQTKEFLKRIQMI